MSRGSVIKYTHVSLEESTKNPNKGPLHAGSGSYILHTNLKLRKIAQQNTCAVHVGQPHPQLDVHVHAATGTINSPSGELKLSAKFRPTFTAGRNCCMHLVTW